MVFNSVEEAQLFYNGYAEKLGFGSRIGCSRRSQKKGCDHLIRRDFECAHARKPKPDGAGGEGVLDPDVFDVVDQATEATSECQNFGSKPVAAKRNRNKLKRHDCKARMSVGLKKEKWEVTIFIEEHTHPMMSRDEWTRYYRSHRKVPYEDYMLIKTLHNRNADTSLIMATLGDLYGTLRTVPYTNRDVANIRTKFRNEVSHNDMSKTIEYFQKLRAESPQFYYAIKLDENNGVRALFWVDGRTREVYRKFKDCVFFDTTFCTNRYDMPFAPIVGINNHMQSMMLGCALIPDEKKETFKWVFETWMDAMGQDHPTCIMTDQDQAMAGAIDEVFPGIVHRCCLWHVLRIAKDKLGTLFRTREGFEKEFFYCIYGSDTVEEFENMWQLMVSKHCLEENEHLNTMWGCRDTWAPAFFKKNFFPFTGTTGRSKGLNSFFKKLVHPQDSVWQFVKQYEYIQETRLDREDNASFIGEATTSAVWSSYQIEEQASRFYTRAAFAKFRELMEMTIAYSIYPVLGDGVKYELHRNDPRAKKIRIVSYDQQENSYMCTCNRFNVNGMLCQHILKAMVHTNVQEIPEKYMLHRWSEAATVCEARCNKEFTGYSVIPESNTLRYNALCKMMNKLVAKACFGPGSYKIIEGGVEYLNSLEDNFRLSGGMTEEETAEETEEAHNNLHNPPQSAKKGRPAEKEKRRKPAVELRQEEAKKKGTKRKNYACSKCQEPDNIRRHCPYEELERKEQADREERLRRETELTL
ncbi:hypothetical protein ACQ4PT_010702 [Festuca glaucescens]